MADPIKLTPNSPIKGPPSPSSLPVKGSGGMDFAQVLEQVDLKFTNHAQKRLETRQINLPDNGLNRLANAVEKAERRGGHEALVLMDDLAFIVNVRERTVITALNTLKRGEGVFTQIDSVVFADPDGQVQK
jgi:flagellar operon protein